jgi:hypothetical protein
VSSFAGFTFLAAALERIAEIALAPWWGMVDAKDAKAEAKNANATGAVVSDPAKKVGITGAAALQATTRAAKARAATTPAATQGAANGATGSSSPEADSAYVKATKQRPTIMLPMAAVAAIVCSYLHLYLLHSIATSGLPNTRLAFVTDGLLTGFAIAGGAQPFHDLIGSLTTSSTAKQAGAKASPPTS